MTKFELETSSIMQKTLKKWFEIQGYDFNSNRQEFKPKCLNP